MPSSPTTVPKKRKRKDKGKLLSDVWGDCILETRQKHVVDLVPEVKKISYLLAITSAIEMKKAAAKRKSKVQNFCLDSDEPWDTFKAQVLSMMQQSNHMQSTLTTTLFYSTSLVLCPNPECLSKIQRTIHS